MTGDPEPPAGTTVTVRGEISLEGVMVPPGDVKNPPELAIVTVSGACETVVMGVYVTTKGVPEAPPGITVTVSTPID